MSLRTDLVGRLGLTYPIIQAPMAGGADTPALAAAVSEAGGLGSLGAAYLTPEQIAAAGQAVRASTTKPFGINLFVPQQMRALGDMSAALARVAPYYEAVGLPLPAAPQRSTLDFDAQVTAALESGATVFSFTLGMLPSPARDAVKARGLVLVGTATTVEEALELERAGVDAVVAQGSEAGGHRGTAAATIESRGVDAGLVGTLALVPQIADAVRVPVIAAGGIMDGRGVAAALALGAGAAQLGTAFLTCDESGVSHPYREALLGAREHETRVTRAFTGRPARGIVNRFMDEVEAAQASHPEDVLPFPLQHMLTRPLRTAAAQQGRADLLSLWAGQGLRMLRPMPAARLMAALVQETDEALGRLAALRRTP